MALIAQGTTPTLKFSYSLDWSATTAMWISFSQYDKFIISVGKEENGFDRFTYKDGFIYVTLTQQETFLFQNSPIKAEIRAIVGGTPMKSTSVLGVLDPAIDKDVIV